MPLSAASIHNAFLLLSLLVGAGVAVASVQAGDGDVNTTMLINGAATTSPLDDTEMYLCYLCTGRNPLLIRYCPIYWDECHLVCYDDDASAATAIPAAAAAAPVPAPPGSAHPAAAGGGVGDDECYVMKLYRNGNYTIVSILSCSQIARCVLSCGGGDMADRNALGAAAVPGTTAAVQGSFSPTDFQRCGTQVTGPRAPSSAAVPGGGARRRR
ncbi:unnamed protein product [Urochloa decumbens]|uniref:Uncharacterized protein n=1 Tax=Urochloa decumbens TaxID=240449 RepID=A0ABC8XSE4_9POAL